MDKKCQSDENIKERQHVPKKPTTNSKGFTNTDNSPRKTRIPYLTKELELTGIKIEVNLRNYDDDYKFEHIPDISKPEYDPRRYFSYKFKHSPPRTPPQGAKKKDKSKIVLDEEGTFSCIDETAKYDLSFDTRYPNYFGDDFNFIKYPPTKDEYPQERPGYRTVVQENTTADDVFQFSPWRERAERAHGIDPIERSTIHLSDLDIIDDDEPHTLIEDKDNETFYNEHFTRLLETGPIGEGNAIPPFVPASEPTFLTNLATEYNPIENLPSNDSQLKSDTRTSLEGSESSDEYNGILDILRNTTMETVYQTANPATKYRTPEEFIESEKIIEREFKFKRPDKFAWYTFNYGEKVETPPPREQLHMFFDPEFKKWADPPPPSEDSDEEENSRQTQPCIYEDCEAEDHRPNPRPEYWIDFDSMREIGRPVVVYHARDFQVYNTDVKPLWIDETFDFEAPIAPHFVTFDDFVYERNPSEGPSEPYDLDDSDIDEPPADACYGCVQQNTQEIYDPQDMNREMYQGQGIPQAYYPVQGYAVPPYQNVPQSNQRYYNVQRYPVHYNVPQMYHPDMYRGHYVPQTNPMYYPTQRYPAPYVPDVYNNPQGQYVPQATPMYYPAQRYPVQYNSPNVYTQEMYRPPQTQYMPRFCTYQRVPVQSNVQETYTTQERHVNQNLTQTTPPPSSSQSYHAPAPTQYNIPETIIEEDEGENEEQDKHEQHDENEQHDVSDNVSDERAGSSRSSSLNPTGKANESEDSPIDIDIDIDSDIDIDTEELDEMYKNVTPNVLQSCSFQKIEERSDSVTPDSLESYPMQEIEEIDQNITSNNSDPYPLQRCPVHFDVSKMTYGEDHTIDDNVSEKIETCQNSSVEDTYVSDVQEIEESYQDVPEINETNRSSPTGKSTVSDISMINIEDLDEAEQMNLTNSTEDESQEYLTPAESPISTNCQTPKDSPGQILPELIVETYASKLRHLITPQSSQSQKSSQSPKSSQSAKSSQSFKSTQSPVTPQNKSFVAPIQKTQQGNIKNLVVKTQRDYTTGTEKHVRRVYWRPEGKAKKTTDKSDKKSNTGSTASNASSSTNVKNLKLLFKESEPAKKPPEKIVSKPVVMKKTQSHPALSDAKTTETASSSNGKQVKRANTEPWLPVNKKKGKSNKSGKNGNKSKGNKNTNNTQKNKQQKHPKSKNG